MIMKSPRSGLVIAMLGLVFSFSAFRSVAQITPCTPTPPPVPFAIVFHGLTSGCSNQPGGNSVCLVGETIQFSVGDHEITCPSTEYNWQFPDFTGPGLWTLTHVFHTAGAFTVNVTITNANGVGHLSQAVTVADAAAIPTISPTVSVLLLLALTLAALSKLR